MPQLLKKSTQTLLFYATAVIKKRFCTAAQHCLQPSQYVQEAAQQRVLKVAVIGMPNAGKSTFINHLIDRKVCPTSSKVHTTRSKSEAIFTEGDAQIVFVDSPGLVTSRIQKRHNLEKAFIKDSESCLQQASVIGVIHDVSDTWKREQLDIKIIKLLEKYEAKPSFLVLNKVDMLKSKRKLLEITRLITLNCLDGSPILNRKPLHYSEACQNKGWPNFKEIFMVSALTGSGLKEVKDYLINSAPAGKWLFPEDVWSDQSSETLIVNTVKAALLDFLPQEIPYQMKPEIELFEVAENGNINASVNVKCASERVAKLAAGGSNGRLRQITEKTQKDLQNIFHEYVNIRITLQSPQKSTK